MFDRYVFVDWSASSKPKRGKDSIWIGEGEVSGAVREPVNPRTRAEAIGCVRERLRQAISADERVLVGFDFPYGYPAGFADTLLSPDREVPAWRRIWTELCALVVDDERNDNNRFHVAAMLNARMGPDPGLFWGCPSSKAHANLAVRKGTFAFGAGGSLGEYRLTETCLRNAGRQPKSVWQLSYAGCVGSQALLGIPRLAELRGEFVEHSAVWPFETGFSVPADRRPLVLHGEIWPGAADIDLTAHPVKDAAQVSGMVRWAQRLDASDRLRDLFEVPGLAAAERDACLGEEGWILGASCARIRR